MSFVPDRAGQRRFRPLWKTLIVGALIAYSPLITLVIVLVLVSGTSSPNDVVRNVFSGLSIVSGVAAVFLYFVAAGVAVIYVDRRRDPETYSFWTAVGSVFLLYFAIVLPFILLAIIAVAINRANQ